MRECVCGGGGGGGGGGEAKGWLVTGGWGGWGGDT